MTCPETNSKIRCSNSLYENYTLNSGSGSLAWWIFWAVPELTPFRCSPVSNRRRRRRQDVHEADQGRSIHSGAGGVSRSIGVVHRQGNRLSKVHPATSEPESADCARNQCCRGTDNSLGNYQWENCVAQSALSGSRVA